MRDNLIPFLQVSCDFEKGSNKNKLDMEELYVKEFIIYYDDKPVAFVELIENNYDDEESAKKLLRYYDSIVRYNDELYVNGFCRLPAEAMVLVSGSSKGTQQKYFFDNKWYKQNRIGYEDLAEVLSTRVLMCSNIEHYVPYKKCIINGKKGCLSENFLKRNETYSSLQRLYDIYYDRELTDVVQGIGNIEDKIQYVLEFVQKITKLDIKEELGKLLTFDMLILNTDRHFNNIGLIIDKVTRKYRVAPVFDNGNALLSNLGEFPYDRSIEENIENVIGKPFYANLERQAMEIGFGLKINYQKLYKLLGREPESRALEVLKYQLKRYEKILRDDNI